MAARKLAPIHPGEILLAEFLEPLGLSQYRVARDISVPPRRINEIVHGTRSISADTRKGERALCHPERQRRIFSTVIVARPATRTVQKIPR